VASAGRRGVAGPNGPTDSTEAAAPARRPRPAESDPEGPVGLPGSLSISGPHASARGEPNRSSGSNSAWFLGELRSAPAASTHCDWTAPVRPGKRRELAAAPRVEGGTSSIAVVGDRTTTDPARQHDRAKHARSLAGAQLTAVPALLAKVYSLRGILTCEYRLAASSG
jgi:hypothetical protein